MHRLSGLMRKEFIQFFRDKALIILIFYTFIEIALCGWALTLEVKNMPMVVYDADRSVESQSLIADFARLESFDLVRQVDSPTEIEGLMDNGVAQMALVIPADFNCNILVRVMNISPILGQCAI
ncbi:MAG: ABC transporter permease [Chloroflexi bacterium]|nr:ABC transporter permease [Chloroflexota bacterium]